MFSRKSLRETSALFPSPSAAKSTRGNTVLAELGVYLILIAAET